MYYMYIYIYIYTYICPALAKQLSGERQVEVQHGGFVGHLSWALPILLCLSPSPPLPLSLSSSLSLLPPSISL